MKKLFAVIIVGILCLSMISIFAPKVKAQMHGCMGVTGLTYYANNGTNFIRSSTPFDFQTTNYNFSQKDLSNGGILTTLTPRTTGIPYADLGFGYTFGTLGNVTSISINGSGTYSINVWFDMNTTDDTAGNGPFFSWSGNVMTGVHGDTYGLGPTITNNGTITPSDSVFLMLNGNTYTIAQLQSGAVGGIDNNTLVGFWFGVINHPTTTQFEIDLIKGQCPLTQYNVTFNQSGVGTDYAGTVVTIDGTNYGVSSLPISFWYNYGSSHTFAFHSPLIVTVNAKRYNWTNTSGLSTLQSGSITVTTSGSITGNYTTQYYLTVKTSPLGLVTAIINISSFQGWYNASTTLGLLAPLWASSANKNYFLKNPGGWGAWDVDGIDQEGDIAHVTMDAPHTATAHYILISNITVGGYAAPIKQSHLLAPSINLSLSLGLAFVFLASIATMAILIKRRSRILH
jgi:hypothetical protein